MACRACGNPNVNPSSEFCPKCGASKPYGTMQGIFGLFLFLVLLAMFGWTAALVIVGIFVVIELFKK